MELIAYDQAHVQAHELPQDAFCDSSRASRHESNSHWQAADLRIRRWYLQREKILAQMQQVQLLLSSSTKETRPLGQALGCFCQQLIDYVSVGHFVIYVQLIKPSQLRCANTLFQLYRTIGTTTDSVLAFNTVYDRMQWLHPAAELDRQLDWLGNQLHTRFALEDTLLSLMEACSPRRNRSGLPHEAPDQSRRALRRQR